MIAAVLLVLAGSIALRRAARRWSDAVESLVTYDQERHG